jgi:hypothetical protein
MNSDDTITQLIDKGYPDSKRLNGNVRKDLAIAYLKEG